MANFFKKVARDEEGASAVEAALIAPILMLLTLGIIYLSILTWTGIAMTRATFIAARCRAVDQTQTICSNVANYAQGLTKGTNLKSSDFSATNWTCGYSSLSTSGLPTELTLQGTSTFNFKALWYLNMSIPVASQACFLKQY